MASGSRFSLTGSLSKETLQLLKDAIHLIHMGHTAHTTLKKTILYGKGEYTTPTLRRPRFRFVCERGMDIWVHDPSWKERPTFGTIRDMSASGLERKCDARAYVEKVEQLTKERDGCTGSAVHGVGSGFSRA